MIKAEEPSLPVRALLRLNEYTEIGKKEFLKEIKDFGHSPSTLGRVPIWEIGDTFSVPPTTKELLYYLCKEFYPNLPQNRRTGNYHFEYFLLVLVNNTITNHTKISRLYFEDPCASFAEYAIRDGEYESTGRRIESQNKLATSMRALGNNQYARLEMLLGKTFTIDSFIEGQKGEYTNGSITWLREIRVPQFSIIDGTYEREIDDEYIETWKRLRTRDVFQVINEEKNKKYGKNRVISDELDKAILDDIINKGVDFPRTRSLLDSKREESSSSNNLKISDVLFDPVKDQRPRVIYKAKAPITVYKILKRKIPNRFNNYKDGELRSFDDADRFKAYTLNSLCSSDLCLNKIFYEWDNDLRQEVKNCCDIGITSMLSMLTDTKPTSWYKTLVCECIIPKDAEYCFMDDRNHFLSNKIIINKVIYEI